MNNIEALYWFDNSRDLVKLKLNRVLRDQVINQTSFLSSDCSIPQRLYHIINDIDIVPKCKMCLTLVSWDRRYKQYKTYCGNPKCPNTDPDIIQQKTESSNYVQQLEKRQQTNMLKYGHTNYLASVQAQQIATLNRENNPITKEDGEARHSRMMSGIQKKYGVGNFSQSKLTSETYQKLNDKDWLEQQHYVEHRTLTDIANELNITSGSTTVGRHLKKLGLETQNPISRSTAERKLHDWLVSLSIEVKHSVRTIVKPFEVDIYLPEYNLAIEYCGLYWHSEQKGKTRSYHKNKYEGCKKKGIQLLTIYADEWTHHEEQIKLKILSLIKKDGRKPVYARKCTLKSLDISQRDAFFAAHHIQGTGSGSLTHGLFYKDELVAVATWQQTSQGIFVLNRYATSCRVVGGCSKLTAYMQRTCKWTQLVSFADLRWSTGEMYLSCGWKLDKVIPPDYYYSPDGHTRFHKFNYRRVNLPKLLKHFDPALSEWENCKANNVFKIWDCGKMRFTINK